MQSLDVKIGSQQYQINVRNKANDYYKSGLHSPLIILFILMYKSIIIALGIAVTFVSCQLTPPPCVIGCVVSSCPDFAKPDIPCLCENADTIGKCIMGACPDLNITKDEIDALKQQNCRRFYILITLML